ncbi:MAG: polyphenol oxidase family protein [Firmicutes bacterium]|nr:polyphenol oxidase family protein [Bacillota bacterium]
MVDLRFFKENDGLYLHEFSDGSAIIMTGLKYDFRRYNYFNTAKILKHFKLSQMPLAKTRQKHTKNIISLPSAGEYVNVDGFITSKRPVMIVTADCIPILIKDKNSDTAALLHSGWRGVNKRIYVEAINKIGRDKDYEVYLLPSIQKKSFQVSDDFVEKFKGRFFFDRFLSNDIGGKYKFDLVRFVKRELIELGINGKDITIVYEDTFTSDLFHSYRREGEGYGLNAIIYLPQKSREKCD